MSLKTGGFYVLLTGKHNENRQLKNKKISHVIQI